MKTLDFATTLTVDQTPGQVFDAINNVRGRWSGEIEGDTDSLGSEFTYQLPGAHRFKQMITTFIPGEKVVWLVIDASLSFVKNKSEWNGTEIIFEIAKKDDKTEVHFRHDGLIPAIECYNSCSNAWGFINGNLRKLITTGKVQPSPW
jgi:hypothetical protein